MITSLVKYCYSMQCWSKYKLTFSNKLSVIIKFAQVRNSSGGAKKALALYSNEFHATMWLHVFIMTYTAKIKTAHSVATSRDAIWFHFFKHRWWRGIVLGYRLQVKKHGSWSFTNFFCISEFIFKLQYQKLLQRYLFHWVVSARVLYGYIGCSKNS